MKHFYFILVFNLFSKKILTRTGFGIYFDKNNSLLASVIIGNVVDYFLQFNIYPGLIKISNFSPGTWMVISRKGQIAFGVSTKYTLGFGGGFDFITKL